MSVELHLAAEIRLHANNIYEIKELAKEIRDKISRRKHMWLYTGCDMGRDSKRWQLLSMWM